MSFANGDNFFPFPIWTPFTYIFSLIALTRLSSTVLNRSGTTSLCCSWSSWTMPSSGSWTWLGTTCRGRLWPEVSAQISLASLVLGDGLNVPLSLLLTSRWHCLSSNPILCLVTPVPSSRLHHNTVEENTSSKVRLAWGQISAVSFTRWWPWAVCSTSRTFSCLIWTMEQ